VSFLIATDKLQLISKSHCSQNDDDWSGFESSTPPDLAKPQKSQAKVKANSSVEDFSSLDVKSKAAPAPKPKDKKEDDLWNMLNS
jgi:hypothetical protein